MSVDPKKPIRFVGLPDVAIHLAGVLTGPDGSQALAVFGKHSDGKWWPKHELYSARTGRNIEDPTSDTVIENAPEISSGFFPLDGVGTTNARGLTTLVFARDDSPYAKHFVEIISEDGVPTEAKIHAR